MSVKPLYNLTNLFQKQIINKSVDILKHEKKILTFFGLIFLYLYMGTIRCMKYIQMVLDFFLFCCFIASLIV